MRRDFWEYVLMAAGFFFIVWALFVNPAYGGELRTGSSGGGVTVGGSITGGTDKCVLFQDGTALGCDADFIFNKAYSGTFSELTHEGRIFLDLSANNDISSPLQVTSAFVGDSGPTLITGTFSVSPTGAGIGAYATDYATTCKGSADMDSCNGGRYVINTDGRTGTISTMTGEDFTLGPSSGGTVTDSRYLHLSSPVLGGGGTIATHRGLYIKDQLVAGITTAFSIDVEGDAPIRFAPSVAFTPVPVTIADSGGAGAATSTLTTPVSNRYRYTCSDADGCNLTLGETSVLSGQELCVTNVSANALNFADTAGVSETAGAFAAGQYDAICFTYDSDRWIEISRSNN